MTDPASTDAPSIWATEVLDTKRHDRNRFHSDVDDLDDYLRHRANQELKSSTAVPYVLADSDEPDRIRGYYTLSSTSANLGELPEETARKLPRYRRVPAILIGRLAVDQRDRGQGVGALLLADAVRRAYATSSAIGAALVVVEALDEDAVAFYQHHGFRMLPDNSGQLFITMREASRI